MAKDILNNRKIATVYGKVWKQGKSLILTIPQATAEGLNISEGTHLRALIEVVEDA